MGEAAKSRGKKDANGQLEYETGDQEVHCSPGMLYTVTQHRYMYNVFSFPFGADRGKTIGFLLSATVCSVLL